MENKEKNFVSAVVYVCNDEESIGEFLRKLNNELNKYFLKYEIICVNDCSTDQSVKKIKSMRNKIDNAIISIVNMSFYQGRELAMNAGMDMAIGDFVYEFDNVNMDYDPETIMKVYKKTLEGYDIVNAKSDRRRYKTSAIFYKIFNKFANMQYELDTETFRILSRRAINRIQSTNKTIPYRKAVYANCGLKMATITYKTKINKNGKIEKNVKRQREKNAIDSLILFTDISYKFATMMAVIMMIVTVIVAIYAISIFIKSFPVQGWTTTILFLAFSFFGIFAMFAIIIKYLSILINLVFKKSKYVIESIEKIN